MMDRFVSCLGNRHVGVGGGDTESLDSGSGSQRETDDPLKGGLDEFLGKGGLRKCGQPK